jgi:hypothetical protein
VTDEMHFGEEGERHLCGELRQIVAALERVERQLRIQNALLRDLFEFENPATYPRPTGGTVSVI